MKEKNVIEYYVLCNKLKNTIRKGWLDWNVSKDRVESVAEHIYGVQMLAIAVASEYDYDIDIFKVVFMLAIHEIEEIIIGDLTFLDISKEEKKIKGHEAVIKVLSNLTKKEYLQNLIFEFDERKTKEALFAYHCDKLECDIQCKLYDQENCVDMSAMPLNRNEFKDMDMNNKSWSDLWIEVDEKLYSDKNFINLLNYIKHNDI